MAVFRDRAYSGQNFLVDLGTGDPGTIEAGFMEVVLPDARIETVKYRSGNDRDNERRKAGTTAEYENLVFKRGVIGSLSLYQWWDQVRKGDPGAWRTINIQLLSEDRTTTVLTWIFHNARPVSHRFSPLNAGGCEPLLEILEVAFERLEVA
jgi:phage tail-like protein